MITLALDTATPRGAVALLRDDTPLGERHFERAAPPANLFDAIVELLAAHRLAIGDVTLIAVGVGPGSFTGIRAGIAAAKGLALPANVPIQAVSTFDALARTALPAIPRECDQLCVECDARRGEVYRAHYDRTGTRIGEIQIVAPAPLPATVWRVSWEDGVYFPSAVELGRLALRREALALEPLYLRQVQYKTVV
jgi:tRNA threonylcarbamoyladenosine biosynthesis protein TsaB